MASIEEELFSKQDTAKKQHIIQQYVSPPLAQAVANYRSDHEDDFPPLQESNNEQLQPSPLCGGIHPPIPYSESPTGFRTEVLGQRLIVDAQRLYGQQISNITLQEAFDGLHKIPKKDLAAWVKALPFEISSSPEFLRRFRKKQAWAESSLTKYRTQTRQIFKFLQQNKLFPIKDPSNFEANLKMIDPTVALECFTFHKAQTGLASSYIVSFRQSLINMFKFYELPCEIDLDRLKEIEKACSKTWGKRRKPTQAIPTKILRYLFVWLKQKDRLAFDFFALAFLLALRASEMIALHKEHVTFSDTMEGSPTLCIKLPLTKTHQETSDDYSLFTFNKIAPDTYDEIKDPLDPYMLVKKFYDTADQREGFLAPFSGTQDARKRALYAWFRVLKREFPGWLLREHKFELDTSLWRYHSLRTTFVAVMRTFGMSWENIKHRVGHSHDSKTTRNTYFFNAMLSEGFNHEIEKILASNIEAQKLFFIADDDDALDEFIFSAEEDHGEFVLQPERLTVEPFGSSSIITRSRKRRNSFHNRKEAALRKLKNKTRTITSFPLATPIVVNDYDPHTPVRFSNARRKASPFLTSCPEAPPKTFAGSPLLTTIRAMTPVRSHKKSPRPVYETRFPNRPHRHTQNIYEYHAPLTYTPDEDEYIPPNFVEYSPPCKTPPPPRSTLLREAFDPTREVIYTIPENDFSAQQSFQALFPLHSPNVSRSPMFDSPVSNTTREFPLPAAVSASDVRFQDMFPINSTDGTISFSPVTRI